MSLPLALSLVAILLSVWSVYYSRRKAEAAEASATAAARSAEVAARALEFNMSQAASQSRARRSEYLDRLVKEGVDDWERIGQVRDLVARETSLSGSEIREVASRVLSAKSRDQQQIQVYVANLLGSLAADGRDVRES